MVVLWLPVVRVVDVSRSGGQKQNPLVSWLLLVMVLRLLLWVLLVFRGPGGQNQMYGSAVGVVSVVGDAVVVVVVVVVVGAPVSTRAVTK